jgi:hypothetical protein
MNPILSAYVLCMIAAAGMICGWWIYSFKFVTTQPDFLLCTQITPVVLRTPGAGTEKSRLHRKVFGLSLSLSTASLCQNNKKSVFSDFFGVSVYVFSDLSSHSNSTLFLRHPLPDGDPPSSTDGPSYAVSRSEPPASQPSPLQIQNRTLKLREGTPQEQMRVASGYSSSRESERKASNTL